KTKIHHVYRTEINDVLLTALALSIREVFGVSKTVIKVEGHGREEIIEDIDIGRTVGWFTTVYPFVLDVSNSKGNELISIKESLRKVPNKGIGYGILNYLDKRFENQLSPSMQFNYLGDFGSNSSSDKDESIFELSSENVGSESDPDNNPTNILLDVSGVMFSEQLSMTIRYSGNLFKQETIDKLIVSYKNQLTNIINELSVIQSNTLSTINSKYDLDDQQWEYGDMLETSPNQRRFLKLESSSVTVNFEISSFNAVTFQEKFREFLSKFPALTLEFVKDKEQLLQRYISPEKVKIKWLIIDMPPVQSDDIDTIGREFLLNKFDIFNQELIRVFVLQKDAYAKIFVSVHHSLADNYTGKILKKELIEFFKDNNIEKANYYHPFTFVKYQKKFLASKLGLKERNHWIKKLADIPLLSKEIVTNNKEFDFIIQETIISDEYFENIKKFSENVNLPVSTMFNAFFEMILNGLTVFDKKIYRVLVDCREQEIKNLEVLKIVGVIDNMLPIVYEDSNFDIEAIRKCYSKYLETRLYQTIPYEIIREDLIDATNKDLDKNTLGYFNFIVDEGDIYINDLNRQSIKYADKNPDFKGVNLSCTLFTNAIKLKLVCDKEIYDAKTAQISLENVLEKFYKLINSNT
ncbi:MAG: condensation domain-containing protein, partial [Flavobacterium sp.]